MKKSPTIMKIHQSNLGFRFVRFDPNGAKHTYGPKDFSRIPYWPFMFLAAAVGTVLWIRWSFSLRTMMIAG